MVAVPSETPRIMPVMLSTRTISGWLERNLSGAPGTLTRALTVSRRSSRIVKLSLGLIEMSGGAPMDPIVTSGGGGGGGGGGHAVRLPMQIMGQKYGDVIRTSRMWPPGGATAHKNCRVLCCSRSVGAALSFAGSTELIGTERDWYQSALTWSRTQE